MNIRDLIKRNTPVLVIGGITVLIFLFIIATAQRGSNSSTKLIETQEGDLLAPHSYVQGPVSAKVTLVEFTDYGCPACQSFHPYATAVFKKYSDKIRYGIRHFPLPQHKNADKAAVAAQVAGEQGRFWEYSELLFENQGKFDNKDLVSYADVLGLDVTRFSQDIKNKAFEDLIDQDVKYAKQLGVNATPTFFVNGKQLKLDRFEDLEAAVERALREAGVNLTGPSDEEIAQMQEQEEVISTEIYKTVDDRFGILEIEFTAESEFKPDKTLATAGQLVRWSNKSDKDITFVQLMPRFQELEQPFVIKTGESFEFRLRLREFGMWTYTYEGYDGSYSIDINKLPDDIAQMLPNYN